MKERPILFNSEMVRAVLDGRKTQTRRVIKPQPPKDTTDVHYNPSAFEPDRCYYFAPNGGKSKCPYGTAGDQLWVRETWGWLYTSGYGYLNSSTPYNIPKQWPKMPIDIVYRADQKEFTRGFKPSIHMPRWASRIQLKVTGVRVERVQDITEEDAKAEGCKIRCDCGECNDNNYREYFIDLWDKINGKPRMDGVDISWSANPWVWCVTFKQVKE